MGLRAGFMLWKEGGTIRALREAAQHFPEAVLPKECTYDLRLRRLKQTEKQKQKQNDKMTSRGVGEGPW